MTSLCLLNPAKKLEDEGEAQHQFPQDSLAAVSQMLRRCCRAVAGNSEAVLSPLECLQLGTVWVLLIFKSRVLWH